MEILQSAIVSTKAEGGTVVMQLGTKFCRMDFETALRLAAFLHHAGKQAKRNLGVQGQFMYGIGTLSDANADEMKAQKMRDGTVMFKGS